MLKGLKFFFKFGWKIEKKYIIYLLLNEFIKAAIPIINIVLPKFIIDELLGSARVEYIILFVGCLLLNNFMGSIISNFLMQTSFKYRLKIYNEFELMICRKTAEADYSNLEDPEFYDMRQKAYQFLYANGKGFSYVLDSAVSIIGKVFILVGIIVIISTLNIFMVLLFIILVLLNSLVESWSKKKTVTLTLEASQVERKNDYYSELFSDNLFAKEIRIFNLKDWLLDQYKKYLGDYKKYYDKQISFSLKSVYFSSLTNFIQQGVAYTYLVIKVIKGENTIGDFSMYLGAISTFSEAMRNVMSSIIDVRQYAPYYEAMNGYLNIPCTMNNYKGERFTDEIQIIEFIDVSFKYPGQSTYALSNINLTILSGEKISIVGENGSGKTTLVKLLLRLYDPTDGQILINGKDIRAIDYNDYLNLFSAVFQDYKLFAFSLKENVRLSNKTVKDNEIITYLYDSGLKKTLKNMEKGIETSIYKIFDESGIEPSGGEGQKIALARALCKAAPVVVLDEPTAALDPRAEYEMYKNFDKLINGKTAFYISHRLSSSKFCDKIIVMSNGKIIEAGSHDELIHKNGLYNELFQMQSCFYVD